MGLVNSIPVGMNEMVGETQVPTECRPARRLTDNLGVFIKSLPSSALNNKGEISVHIKKAWDEVKKRSYENIFLAMGRAGSSARSRLPSSLFRSV